MQQQQTTAQKSVASASDSVADAWLRASRQQLLEDLAIKDRDLRTCSKKVSSPWGPWWVRALLWFATVFLVAIAIWGIVSLVYVNRLGKGIAGARAELAALNAQIAHRVQILSEDDALAASSSSVSSTARYYPAPLAQPSLPIETGSPVILSNTASASRAAQVQAQQQQQQPLQQSQYTPELGPERGTKIF